MDDGPDAQVGQPVKDLLGDIDLMVVSRPGADRPNIRWVLPKSLRTSA
jgi:hypothetical protein